MTVSRATLLFAAAIVCAGCQLTPNVVSISAPFRAAEAERLVAYGANTISGRALLRQASGNVVTCAGGLIDLIPATAYATERMRAIFGSDETGFEPIVGRKVALYTPDPPEYEKYRRQANCDSSGTFRFERVADGDFFVLALVSWQPGTDDQGRGGLLMQRVSVRNGESKEIDLSR